MEKPEEPSDAELKEMVNKIVEPYGLHAEIFPGIRSVGVGGDHRSYARVANLIGSFPGWEILDQLSREIGNTLPINRITFQTAEENQESQQ